MKIVPFTFGTMKSIKIWMSKDFFKFTDYLLIFYCLISKICLAIYAKSIIWIYSDKLSTVKWEFIGQELFQVNKIGNKTD